MINNITCAGIRLTRNCNMKCMYCNIQNTKREDLSIDEWKEALKILKSLDIKDVVLLGGEPTMYPNVVELVDYLTHELGMSCSLTTNAFGNFDVVKELLDAGLASLGVSVDNLDPKKSISPLKAKNGLKLIDYLLSYSNDYNLTNYTVLNKNNADSIIELIEYMNSKLVNTYILPFHWGNEGSFEHRKDNEKFAFITDEDLNKYNTVVDKIIDLKNDGYRIKNSSEFLEASKNHIKNLDWKCSGLSELRIDADGKLVCCCDKVGKVNEEFSIFDLETRLDDFCKVRESDAENCKGCLWPSSFEAELRRVKKK